MPKSEQLIRIDNGSRHHRVLDTATEYYIEITTASGTTTYTEHNVGAKGIHDGIFLSLPQNRKIGLPPKR